MDLWDLTKALFRRWYIALPVLLASVAVVLYMAATVKPDYVAKGYLQLIPPATGPADPNSPGAKARTPNVWLDLGLGTLANAAVVKVIDPPVLSKLVEQGYAESVVITQPTQSPLLYIEAVASTPELSTQTVRAIIAALNKDIQSLQAERNIATDDMVTTLTLNDGATPDVKTSKVKRVVAMAGAIGLLITTVGTVLVDMLLRRRAQARQAGSSSERDLKPTSQPVTNRGSALPEQRNGAQSTVIIQASPVTTNSPAAAARMAARANMPTNTATTTTGPPTGEIEREDRSQPEPDATIVLPLSLGSRDRSDRRS